MNRLINLSPGLNAGVPLSSNTGHSDVLDDAFDIATLAVSNPAQPGKPDATVPCIYFATLRETEAATNALLLEGRKISAFLKKVFACSRQVFEYDLIGL